MGTPVPQWFACRAIRRRSSPLNRDGAGLSQSHSPDNRSHLGPSSASCLEQPQAAPGGEPHYMKVTTYAPPFRPPCFRSLENLYSFDPYILTKMRKMSYFDPYFSSKLGKMYNIDPPFFTSVAFRVDGRCWASLSETWPSTPTPTPIHPHPHPTSPTPHPPPPPPPGVTYRLLQ